MIKVCTVYWYIILQAGMHTRYFLIIKALMLILASLSYAEDEHDQLSNVEDVDYTLATSTNTFSNMAEIFRSKKHSRQRREVVLPKGSGVEVSLSVKCSDFYMFILIYM